MYNHENQPIPVKRFTPVKSRELIEDLLTHFLALYCGALDWIRANIFWFSNVTLINSRVLLFLFKLKLLVCELKYPGINSSRIKHNTLKNNQFKKVKNVIVKKVL